MSALIVVFVLIAIFTLVAIIVLIFAASVIVSLLDCRWHLLFNCGRSNLLDRWCRFGNCAGTCTDV